MGYVCHHRPHQGKFTWRFLTHSSVLVLQCSHHSVTLSTPPCALCRCRHHHHHHHHFIIGDPTDWRWLLKKGTYCLEKPLFSKFLAAHWITPLKEFLTLEFDKNQASFLDSGRWTYGHTTFTSQEHRHWTMCKVICVLARFFATTFAGCEAVVKLLPAPLWGGSGHIEVPNNSAQTVFHECTIGQ